jgi:phosphoribosyl-ATP pyrophosphohydrolase/phosphoribosyl-AMP cyclohydrolase
MPKKNIEFLTELQDLIDKRRKKMPDNSYTTSLFKKGINKIAQKVGEEAVELIIEAKDNDKEKFLNESADLLYHLLVLFTAKGYRIEDVVKVLKERHR